MGTEQRVIPRSSGRGTPNAHPSVLETNGISLDGIETPDKEATNLDETFTPEEFQARFGKACEQFKALDAADPLREWCPITHRNLHALVA